MNSIVEPQISWSPDQMIEITLNEPDNDVQRRNRIIQLLLDWGLVSVVSTEKVNDIAPLNQIKVISYKEKGDWNLETKYNIGKRKKPEEE